MFINTSVRLIIHSIQQKKNLYFISSLKKTLYMKRKKMSESPDILIELKRFFLYYLCEYLHIHKCEIELLIV
jgi:hypothetical protein